MNSTSRQGLAQSLTDFESRHLQVAANIHIGIPLQIRTMREARGWNQTELAEKVGTTQNAISRLESSAYGKPNVKTLLRLAEAFDVALLVKFVTFGRFVRTLDEASSTSVVVPSFDDDEDFENILSNHARKPMGSTGELSGAVRLGEATHGCLPPQRTQSITERSLGEIVPIDRGASYAISST